MKILVAPDSFKESLSAVEAAAAICRGFESVFPEAQIVALPMADGGEGTLDALLSATEGERRTARVRGPLGSIVEASWGMLGDGRTAIIEMAQASGLHLVPREQRNPLNSSSEGVGDLILAALTAGAKHCLISLGGSATVDGGLGMLRALGVKCLDADGELVVGGGGALNSIRSVHSEALHPILQSCSFTVLADVENPAVGPLGAARVFAPQKGADPVMVVELERGLEHWTQLVNPALATKSRSGAAGALGFALAAFLGASLRSGVEVVAETLGLGKACSEASIVITGEGCINFQTPHGKVPSGVAAVAKRWKRPVLAIAGTLGDGYEAVLDAGIDAVFSISPGPGTLEHSIEHAKVYLERASQQIARTLKVGREL